MAAGEFLKVAAAQVRQASMMLKQEAQSMTSQREDTERQKSSSITEAQLKLKARQIELNDPNKNQGQKQEIAKEVNGLQQAITNEQREMREITQKLAEEASKKQSQAQQLDERASELETQASAL